MKIHIDIDCFFVSALRIVEPDLEHKAVAIGGRSDTQIFDKASGKNQVVNFVNSGNFVPTFYKALSDKNNSVIHRDTSLSNGDIESFKDASGRVRGILTTSSYEARAYGVKTAMSIREALQLCPHLIIKEPDMALYQKLSHELHDFLALKIPLVEQASIDEFYGDLSGWVADDDVAAFIDALRHEIKKELSLPVSIGAAQTRYIAKLATTYAKPFGSKVIYAHNFDTFVNPIKIKDFAGIGRSMYAKLSASHIHTLGELRANRGRVESFGPYAVELYKRVNAESDEPIKTTRRRKSIGISRTFDPLFCRDELRRRVHVLVRHLSYAIWKLRVIPTLFHLGISYEMKQKSHKNITLAEVFTEKKFDRLCMELLSAADTQKRLHVIRISITCSNFTRDSRRELSLIGFDDEQKFASLTNSLQELRQKYGLDSVKFASEL